MQSLQDQLAQKVTEIENLTGRLCISEEVSHMLDKATAEVTLLQTQVECTTL